MLRQELLKVKVHVREGNFKIDNYDETKRQDELVYLLTVSESLQSVLLTQGEGSAEERTQ